MSPDTLSLASKVAIVTGSGRENGIGAAIARALARNGAAVTIHYVSDSSASRAAKVAQGIRDNGGKATVVQADVINNAGGNKLGRLLDVSPEELGWSFALNTFGPLYMAQAVVEQGKMPQGGRIINIGTAGSKMGASGLGSYLISKAALDSMTEILAQELGRTHDITVNTVAPGPVKTDLLMETNKVLGVDFTELLKAKQRGSDRLADPEDIADVVAWVASEKARWITAQFISASSGLTGTM
ncbi:unnamed protein product [Clonostachys rhizophaga]|uniref:Uncharacterized protein n=2 Tax=Clonostachys TaxID=110564 RepID=A0A9N9VYU0_9HYPO|nr:unnamed protein product [Clonostachys rhizophaga]CAI6091671.1 unnamed protein product [Clonostachys chloroleuca]